MPYGNVEPPRHQTLEAGNPTPGVQPLEHLPRPAGEKAVEGGTMLTEIAERSELPLSAVVLSVHPGHPSEGGWPGIHVAPF
jgi:hypothetical protein